MTPSQDHNNNPQTQIQVAASETNTNNENNNTSSKHDNNIFLNNNKIPEFKINNDNESTSSLKQNDSITEEIFKNDNNNDFFKRHSESIPNQIEFDEESQVSDLDTTDDEYNKSDTSNNTKKKNGKLSVENFKKNKPYLFLESNKLSPRSLTSLGFKYSQSARDSKFKESDLNIYNEKEKHIDLNENSKSSGNDYLSRMVAPSLPSSPTFSSSIELSTNPKDSNSKFLVPNNEKQIKKSQSMYPSASSRYLSIFTPLKQNFSSTRLNFFHNNNNNNQYNDDSSDSEIPLSTLFVDRLARLSDVTVGSNSVPPETEYFGFGLYLFSGISLIIYLIWSFIPQEILNYVGIYYYPSKWWAVSIPSFILMLTLYIYIALSLYNIEILTKPLDSLDIITDEVSKIAVFDNNLNNTTQKRKTKNHRKKVKSRKKRSNIKSQYSMFEADIDTDIDTDTDINNEISNTQQSNPQLNINSNLNKYYYFWNPSNGVWDLPLIDICKVLYSTTDDEEEELSSENDNYEITIEY